MGDLITHFISNNTISIPRIFILGILSCLVLLGCKSEKDPPLLIATAANMQFVIEELLSDFEHTYQIKSEKVISSSGNLTAQIVQGAPYDVFLSADVKYPNELYARGLTTTQPKIYAFGKLVLCTAKEEIEPDIQSLKDEDIKVIAIANPDIAPYGAATKEYLENISMYHELSKKMVFGESISQTNSFIISKAADMGFTSMSAVLSSGLRKKARWVEVDPGLYTTIAQGLVVLKSSQKKEEAKKFAEYLMTPSAKEILSQNGYSVKTN